MAICRGSFLSVSTAQIPGLLATEGYWKNLYRQAFDLTILGRRRRFAKLFCPPLAKNEKTAYTKTYEIR
jgi:hypothetical protein